MLRHGLHVSQYLFGHQKGSLQTFRIRDQEGRGNPEDIPVIFKEDQTMIIKTVKLSDIAKHLHLSLSPRDYIKETGLKLDQKQHRPGTKEIKKLISGKGSPRQGAFLF